MYFPENSRTDQSTLQVKSIKVSEDYDLLDESARAEVEVTRPFNRWEQRVLDRDLHLAHGHDSFDLQIVDGETLVKQIDRVLSDLEQKSAEYRGQEELKRSRADQSVLEARRRLSLN